MISQCADPARIVFTAQLARIDFATRRLLEVISQGANNQFLQRVHFEIGFAVTKSILAALILAGLRSFKLTLILSAQAEINSRRGVHLEINSSTYTYCGEILVTAHYENCATCEIRFRL